MMEKPQSAHARYKRVVLILLTFACAGCTVLIIKKPIFTFLNLQAYQGSWLFWLFYLLIMFPLYQGLLLGYACIFGQFNYFWEKEKKLFKRIFRRS